MNPDRKSNNKSKNIFIIALLCIFLSLSISFIRYYFSDPYENVKGELQFLLVVAGSFLSLAILFSHQLVKILSLLRKLTTNTKIAWIVILLSTQLTIASICYWIYYKNPNLYVLADEIQNRYLEIAHSNTENEIKKIEGLNDDVVNELKMLKYIEQNEASLIKSSDGNLIVNDSIYIVKELAFSPPGNDEDKMTIKIYTKRDLEFIMFLFVKLEPFEIAIEKRISLLEKKVAAIQNELDQVKSDSAENRWGYLYFLSYYFREQIQPMTKMLITFDFIKYIIWILLSLAIPSLSIKSSTA
jgi:nitrate reductase NapE component